MTPELSDDIDRLALATTESRALRAQSAFFLDTCMRHPRTDEEVLSELRSATVNLHKASTEHRSSNFYSKGEARAAVDEWL